MKEILKKNKIIVIILSIVFVVVIFIVPLIINILYKSNSSSVFSTEWDSGDALSFYGATLTLVGSILVSSIALLQTYRLNKITEQRYFEDKRRPYFNIKEVFGPRNDHQGLWIYYYDDDSFSYTYNDKETIELSIMLKNCGEGDAFELTYNGAFFGDDREKISKTVLKDDKLVLTKIISLNKDKTILSISYKNILGCKYKQDIMIKVFDEVDENYNENDNTDGIIKRIKVFPISLQKVL